ncbi:ABC transporter permease [Jiangella muralis]|uniref:ABC transporter permease n=1 Tax=Jiangella muralis TaxID=702383 RepID=UPI0009F86684|nr:ABC transporter permease subunit [Jiangella muralis]
MTADPSVQAAGVASARAVVPGRSSPAPGAASRRKRKAAVWGVRLAFVAAVLGVWQWLGIRDGGIFIATFTDTAAALLDLAGNGSLWPAVWASNQSLLLGFPLATVLGLAVGFLLGRHRTVDRATGYWLDIALVIPMVAMVPVIIVALGLTLSARVVVVFLFTFPVVALNARAAVRVPLAQLEEMARSFEASPAQVWRTVILPGAAAPLFTGTRIALSRAISGMIVIELTLIPAGLGGAIINYTSQFSAANLYAMTLAVVLEGLVLVGLATWAERAVIRRLKGVSRGQS